MAFQVRADGALEGGLRSGRHNREAKKVLASFRLSCCVHIDSVDPHNRRGLLDVRIRRPENIAEKDMITQKLLSGSRAALASASK